MLGYTTMRGNSLQFLHSVHWKLTLPFWLHLKPCFMKGNSSRLSPQRPWQVQTARSQGRPRKTPEVDSIHQVFVFCHAMTVMVTTQKIQRQRQYGKDNSKETKEKTTWQVGYGPFQCQGWWHVPASDQQLWVEWPTWGKRHLVRTTSMIVMEIEMTLMVLFAPLSLYNMVSSSEYYHDWPCGEGAGVRELIIYNKSRGQEV